jgi:hypothetical protein
MTIENSRKYQHLWEHLRDNSHLQLTAPKSTHPTIMQALRRESLADTVFRFKCVEKGRAYRIRFAAAGDCLLIHLEWISNIPKDFIGGRRK